MRLDILLIFGWLDGPIEGVARESGGQRCWFFRLIAERVADDDLDDRLFGLWPISETDCLVLIEEFGEAEAGAHVWPVGGLGSADARRIVEMLAHSNPTDPSLIVRTVAFGNVDDVWRYRAPDALA